MNRLHLIGISYKQLDSKDLSKFHISEKDIPFYLKRIHALKEIKEAALLSTCNRTEIYFVTKRPDCGDDIVSKTISEMNFPHNLSNLFYHYKGKRALSHILKVASSLDSMIIGENEITGQFKNAFDIAVKNKIARDYLSLVFREAMSAVKKIKNSTEISRGSISVGRTAIEILKREVKNFKDKKILIVGAGNMGRLFIRAIKEYGAYNITLTNRSHEKAISLSGEYATDSIPFDNFKSRLANFDIIILATSASNPIVKYDEIKDAVKTRAEKLYIVDIGIPRNSEKDISKIKKILLLDMDYIKKEREKNFEFRKKYLPASLKIVKEHTNKFQNLLVFNEIFPSFYKMRESVMKFTNLEIDKIVKSNHLDNKTEAILRNYNNMVMDKLIRRHISAVKKIMDNKKIAPKDITSILEKMIEVYD